MIKKNTSAYNTIVNYIIYFLIFISPLARGSVLLWTKAAIMIIVLTASFILLMEKIITGKPDFNRTPLDRPILALLFVLVISNVFAVHPPLGIETIMLITSYIMLYYLIVYSIRTRRQQRQLVYVIIGTALFLSVFGFVKLFGLNPFDIWEYGIANRRTLVSTYVNYSHTAGYLEMAIPLVLCLFITKNFMGGSFFLILYIASILLTAQTLTLSRGGWTSTVVSLIFMMVVLLFHDRFKRKKLLLSIFFGSLFLILFTLATTNVVARVMTIYERETEVNMGGRLDTWHHSMAAIKEYPLTGTGPGSFATVFTQYQQPGIGVKFLHTHNDYIQAVFETGIIIIPIILWVVVTLFRSGFKNMREPSRQIRGITLGCMTGVVAILMHSTGDFNLQLPANAMVFVVLISMVMGVGSVSSRIPKGDGF